MFNEKDESRLIDVLIELYGGINFGVGLSQIHVKEAFALSRSVIVVNEGTSTEFNFLLLVRGRMADEVIEFAEYHGISLEKTICARALCLSNDHIDKFDIEDAEEAITYIKDLFKPLHISWFPEAMRIRSKYHCKRYYTPDINQGA